MKITQIIDLVINTYNKEGSSSLLFKEVYARYEQALNRHKNIVLKTNLGCEVILTGRLCRRGDGQYNNLNLISPAYINGVKVEHLHVYDEVIEAADINNITNLFIAENMKIYKFGRKHKDFHLALGIKPKDCPIWKHRHEIVD